MTIVLLCNTSLIWCPTDSAICTSGQNDVTGIRLTLLPKTTIIQKKKIHETMIAKILYTRWWKAMILRDGKQGEPYNCTSLLPLESFQTNSTDRGIQAKPIGHSWVEEMIRNTKMSRIHRTELQISPVFRKSALCHFALTEDLY